MGAIRKNIPIRAISTFESKGGRPSQEDFFLNTQEKGIFAIADGFGGMGPGLNAARTACESIRGFLVKEARDRDATMPFVLRSYISLAGNVLFNAVVHANRKVCKLNENKGVHERGGASLLAGFLDGDLLALANVGCCSAWLMRGGSKVELVSPRSYARLSDPFRGEGAQELAVPLAAIGVGSDVEPEVFECRLQEGDWLILHTDGLIEGVREELAQLQSLGLNSEQVSQRFLNLIENLDFNDNISVSLIIF